MSAATSKILIVDDEPSVLYAFQRCLRKHFQIETAESGAAALSLIAQNGPYAVVLSDLHMPGMDGVELLSLLADLAPTTTRVALTGSCERAQRDAAFTHGRVFAFLSKPCALEEVTACLQEGIQYHEEREAVQKSATIDSRASIPFAFQEAV